jgi:hypothetical protein
MLDGGLGVLGKWCNSFMKYQRYILPLIALIGFVVFYSQKNAVIDGNCSGTPLECRQLGEYAVYLWRLRDFSLAVLIIGMLNLINPAATRILIVLTVAAVLLTAVALMSAPDLRTNILSPFDKKFVGQLGAGIYFAVALVVWLTALYRSRKKHD